MFELDYSNTTKFRAISSNSEGDIEKSKKIVEAIEKLLTPEHSLEKVEVSGDCATIAYRKADLDMEQGFDYEELTFFQEKGERGYYSSYGFGSVLRELKKGKLEDYFKDSPENSESQNAVFAGCFRILEENGIKLEVISFRRYFPSEYE